MHMPGMGLKSCMQLPVDRLSAHMLGQAARPHALSTVELETGHAFREGRLVRCEGHASCRAEGRGRCTRSGYLSDWEQYLDMISGYAATVPFMTLEGVRARPAPPSAWSCVGELVVLQTTRAYNCGHGLVHAGAATAPDAGAHMAAHACEGSVRAMSRHGR
jgi:hypothetical protein